MRQDAISAALVLGGGEGGGSGSGDVTGVKGSAESSYRQGNVNISASNVGAYSTSEVDTALAGKVDKETGKGLSKNDYTDADKAIVGGVTSGLAGKADRVSSATNGHFAGLDASGNLTDSGKKASDFATPENVQDSINTSADLLKDTVGWTGKNLNQTKYIDSVIDRKGIDWTYSSVTGIITANGTSTDKSTFGADSKYSFVAPCTSQVILSGCNNENSNVHIYPYDMTTNSRPYKDSTKTSLQNSNVYGGGEVSFYMEEGHNYTIACRINASGITVDNFKFYPLLRKAEISDPTFEPYHKDVVDTLRDAEVITGKNIIPLPYYSQIDGNNAGTIEPTVNSDGSITFSAGTSSAGTKYYYLISRFDSHFTVPAGRYWCSGIPSDAPEGITLLFGCTRNGEGYTYNTLYAGDAKVGNVKTGDELGLTIVVNPNTTISSDITFYPMICTEADWNKSHDYEPYYIPVKDAMFRRSEQRVLGAKNLYDTNATSKTDAYGGVWTVNDDNTITVSGTPTDYDPFSTRSYYVLPAGEYILSWNGENLTNVALDTFRLCKGNTEVRVVGTNKTSALAFTISNGDDYDNIRIAFKRVTNNVAMSGTIKPMIRLASDPDDTYVPYAMTNKELTEKVFEKRVLSSADDLNDIKTTGIYGTTTSPTNAPESQTYGTLIVQATSSGDVRQLFWRAGGSGGLVYIRSYGGNPGTWTSWFKFEGTVVS